MHRRTQAETNPTIPSFPRRPPYVALTGVSVRRVSVSACVVSVHANKQPERREGGEVTTTTNTSQLPHFWPEPPPLPPSPSVSEKLRVPPPANKAIRDGKDADTAAFQRHSEQKRWRRGRQRGIGRGLNQGGGGGGICCGFPSKT